MQKIISAILLMTYLTSCQTTKYISNGGDFRLGLPADGEKIVRHVRAEMGESYFLFGAIPAVEQRAMEDFISLNDTESLVNLQLENKITGMDFLAMIGLCIITACISSIVWTKRTTILTGDIVVDAPAH